MLLQFSGTLLFSKCHACKKLSSSTFCSSTCLMLKFLVWKRSQVLLHKIAKHCIQSPAGTGGFLENSTNCWANISLCCSAHLCTQAGIGPTEINTEQSQAVLEITPLQCQQWWLKSAAVFLLGRNWFLSSLGPATKTSAFLHAAEHNHVLWVQQQQLPCGSEAEHKLQVEFHTETFLCTPASISPLPWSLPTAQQRPTIEIFNSVWSLGIFRGMSTSVRFTNTNFCIGYDLSTKDMFRVSY